MGSTRVSEARRPARRLSGPLRRAALAAAAIALIAIAGPASAAASPGWLDGTHSHQYFNNCFGGQGSVQSYVGYWGDSDGSYPVSGDRYWGHVVVSVVGNPCAGGDFAATDIMLPPYTDFDFAGDPNGHVRCFYTDGLSEQTGEVTSDPAAGCTQSPGPGYSGFGRSLGGRTVAAYHIFEIEFPLRTTDQLGGSATQDRMVAPITTGIAAPAFAAPQQWVWVFAPAATTINSGPTGTVTATAATFTFSADKRVDHFECRLDAQGYAPCSSPKTYTGLSDGPHAIQVRAIGFGDGAGPAATRAWTIGAAPPDDTTAPAARITSGPAGPTSDATPTFAFTANEAGSTFRCRLDGGAYEACISPRTTAPLSDGDHRFLVRAVDGAGNVGADAARAFSVDTARPAVTIDGPTKVRTRRRKARARFSFAASEPATFECRLDGGALAPCRSPLTTPRLRIGRHTLVVTATDRAANAARASSSFKVVRKRKRR